jgi:hypothetical protein
MRLTEAIRAPRTRSRSERSGAIPEEASARSTARWARSRQHALPARPRARCARTWCWSTRRRWSISRS